MLYLLCLLAVLAVQETAALDCCVYTDEFSECDDINCPGQCVVSTSECPMQSGCFLVSRDPVFDCTEPGNCQCSMSRVMDAAKIGGSKIKPHGRPSKKEM